MSKGKKTGIIVGMATLALLGLTTGCRGGLGGLGSGFSNFSWGCLSEADSAGAPAYAELATVDSGQVVRVWSNGAVENVTLEVLGGAFADVAPGAHGAGADGMIDTGDLAIDVLRCEGETMEETVCTPVDTASIEVALLEDGARRVTYHGLSSEDGETVPVDGSFVVGR